MAIGAKEINIKKAFSVGFVEDKGRNVIPNFFAGYIRNGRIENGTVTVRKGYKVLVSPNITGTIQGMFYTDQLYFLVNGFLYSIYSLISPVNIGYTGKVNIFTYGQYAVILTGVGNPRVYSSSTGLFQVPDSNMPFDDNLTVPFSCDLKPIIGECFTGFSFIVGANNAYNNILYISKPVRVDVGTGKPLNQFIYDWSITLPRTSDSGEWRVMTSKILGLKANLNNLYIFCEKTIEILGKQSVANVGGIETLYTQPIGDGDQLLNPNCLVVAGNLVFYITKNLKVKSIGYQSGIENPIISGISDKTYISIEGFIDDKIDNLQENAFGYYDKKEAQVRWYLKTYGVTYNNICLIYDLNSQSFLIDDNKNFSNVVVGFSNNTEAVFASSANSVTIYEDNSFNYDEVSSGNYVLPNFEYNTTNITFGAPSLIKQFRGCLLSGGINTTTNIRIRLYVDGVEVLNKVINYSNVSTPAGNQIGGPNQSNRLYPIDVVIDQGNLRTTGKMIRLKLNLESNSINPDFYFDFLSFTIRPLKSFSLADKI